MVEAQPLGGEHRVERLGLHLRPRIAVEGEPGAGIGRVEAVGQDAVDDLVGDQLAGVHHRLRLLADGVPAATAARSMSPVDS